MKYYIFSPFLVLLLIFSSCEEEQEPRPEVNITATDIRFTTQGIDRNLQDFEGTATITGYFTNTGMDTYVTAPSSNNIEIYQSSNGGGGIWTLVASQDFTELDPNETISISYSRPWNISSAAEGEFPPSYRINFIQGPDYLLDSEYRNDETNINDNSLTESGAEINQL